MEYAIGSSIAFAFSASRRSPTKQFCRSFPYPVTFNVLLYAWQSIAGIEGLVETLVRSADVSFHRARVTAASRPALLGNITSYGQCELGAARAHTIYRGHSIYPAARLFLIFDRVIFSTYQFTPRQWIT